MWDFSTAQAQHDAFDSPPIFRQSSPVEEFASYMADRGLHPGDVVGDDEIHRFSTKDNGRDKNGWYALHIDCPIPWGVFGNWSTGLTRHWSAKAESEMSSAELEAFKKQVKEAKAARKTHQDALHAAAKERAEREWNQARPASSSHPYLASKGVASYGLRVTNDGRLIVPLEDIYGDIHSLQFISASKDKRFLTNGAIAGNFFTIPGNEKVYVCEG